MKFQFHFSHILLLLEWCNAHRASAPAYAHRTHQGYFQAVVTLGGLNFEGSWATGIGQACESAAVVALQHLVEQTFQAQQTDDQMPLGLPTPPNFAHPHVDVNSKQPFPKIEIFY